MGGTGPIGLRIYERHSQKVALRQGKAVLTYSELNRRADLLAAHLAHLWGAWKHKSHLLHYSKDSQASALPQLR